MTVPLSALDTLSDSQREVFLFIQRKVEEGQSPTVREIQARFGYRSLNAVICHLRRLERKGFLTRSHYKKRSLKVSIPWEGKDLKCVALVIR